MTLWTSLPSPLRPSFLKDLVLGRLQEGHVHGGEEEETNEAATAVVFVPAILQKKDVKHSLLPIWLLFLRPRRSAVNLEL